MILYHYTSIETLYAIIKGIENEDENNLRFSLRATHADFLNDLTEGNLLPNALRKLGISEGVLNILQSIQGHPFVASLSELDDDLNMWRCYANQGKGVAIGLDKDVLSEALTNQNWCNIAELCKCEYYSEKQLVNYLKSNNIGNVIQDPNRMNLDRLLSNALKFKNKSFEAEKEWRIYANYIGSDFRVSDGLVIPYYNILLPIGAILSITFGPKNDFRRNRFSVFNLIKCVIGEQQATRIELKKSSVPYV